MGELIDAGTGFAGAGVAGDEPAATKLIAFPRQTAKLRDMRLVSCVNNKSRNAMIASKNSANCQEVLRMSHASMKSDGRMMGRTE